MYILLFERALETLNFTRRKFEKSFAALLRASKHDA